MSNVADTQTKPIIGIAGNWIGSSENREKAIMLFLYSKSIAQGLLGMLVVLSGVNEGNMQKAFPLIQKLQSKYLEQVKSLNKASSLYRTVNSGIVEFYSFIGEYNGKEYSFQINKDPVTNANAVLILISDSTEDAHTQEIISIDYPDVGSDQGDVMPRIIVWKRKQGNEFNDSSMEWQLLQEQPLQQMQGNEYIEFVNLLLNVVNQGVDSIE